MEYVKRSSRMAKRQFRKVYVIGLDGATLNLVRPWAEQGHLPTLGRLMSEGVYGELESVVPPVSAPAWSTFATGRNPGSHGVYGFRTRIPGTYDLRLVNGRDRAGRPIWRMLSEQGLCVGVINIPVSYPPEPVNGHFISGLTTPGRQGVCYTHPVSLADELAAELGEYIIEPPLFEDARRGDEEALWKKISRHLDNQIAAAKYLLNMYEYDFFAMNFRATDSGGHNFWEGGASDGGARLLDIYVRLDSFLEWLVDVMPPETLLLVMSDHGMGPAGDRAVLLNRWLEQQGYLAICSNRVGVLPWQRCARWIRYHVPGSVRQRLRRLFPRTYEHLRAPGAHFLYDWSKTRAFADEQLAMIWINLLGRDPQGIVRPGEEYETLVTEIQSSLLDLRDPETNSLVFSRVERCQDVYHGARLRQAPDLILWPAEEPPCQIARSDLVSVPGIFLPLDSIETGLPILRGQHRRMGLFIAWGDGVRATTHEISGCKIADIPPTLLHALGCPVPRSMEGESLLGLLGCPDAPLYEDVSLIESDVTEDTSRDRGVVDDETVLERLRGLGYID